MTAGSRDPRHPTGLVAKCSPHGSSTHHLHFGVGVSMFVPIFGSDPAQINEVQCALNRAGLPFEIQKDWRSFLDATAESGVGILVFRKLTGFPSGVSFCPASTRAVVVTYLHSATPPSSADCSAAVALSLDSDPGHLVPMVERLLRRFPFLRWAHAFREKLGLPGALRHALASVMEQEPPLGPVATGEPGAIPKSVRSLANRLGCSEDHIGRLARHAGVDLPTFLKWNIALRAIQLRGQPGMSWEIVAWRLGFASISGLSESLKQTLGLRPSEFGEVDFGFWAREFEERFLNDS